tara:strand:+ start:94211 stop:94327 length:117 start_codon:yes stop_codon:yes gene_type:complete
MLMRFDDSHHDLAEEANVHEKCSKALSVNPFALKNLLL